MVKVRGRAGDWRRGWHLEAIPIGYSAVNIDNRASPHLRNAACADVGSRPRASGTRGLGRSRLGSTFPAYIRRSRPPSCRRMLHSTIYHARRTAQPKQDNPGRLCSAR